MITLVSRAVLLADDGDDIDPTTGHGPEWGKASPVGLLVILLMGIALFFLMRSMVKHLKKVQAMKDPLPDEPVASALVPGQNDAEPQVDDAVDQAAQADPGSGPPGLVGERSG
jgi:hypothetical protein